MLKSRQMNLNLDSLSLIIDIASPLVIYTDKSLSLYKVLIVVGDI